jgi:hypothetical protein
MRRRGNNDAGDAGQDSFLDIVTNIVGILIILVMVIGGRIQHLAITRDRMAVEPSPIDQEVKDLAFRLASTESEVDELQVQSRTVATAAALATEARLHLAHAVSTAEAGVEQLRRDGDTTRNAAAEAAARRQRLEEEIERLDRLAAAAVVEPRSQTEVLAYPTPIGRTVNGGELHFRIAAGHVAPIPLEELFELAKRQTQRQSGPVSALASRIETVGPTAGFSLDYVIEARVDQARGQVLIRSREWVVRPVEEPVGEPVAEALAGGSRFRRVLATAAPDTTVTLWCYPDGFAAYREIREELHRQGVPTAGRPLPEGAPIGGSAEGSKSVVQ